ncbi:MAG: hypothetical protein OEV85_06255 [Candidatus Thorarchaeota archaeon]|nr:hypothetical protein [Candidatus Thorarchaeota archaeon]
MENGGGIGTLQERSLHAAIKKMYAGPETQMEVAIDGYVVDVVRDGLLIEIQTRNFTAIKDKLFTLMKNHRIRLVYPIPYEKWIVRQSPDGINEISRRRSPKQLGIANVFEELVSIPTFLRHKNFSLEVILIREEEIRIQNGKGSWRRRGWSNSDRKLLEVIERHLYSEPSDFLHFIPNTLERPFTTNELAEVSDIPKRIAQKMTYCMRKMGILKIVGKDRNAYLYTT